MTYKTPLAFLFGAAALFAADPGYLNVTLTNVKPGKTQEYTDYYKKFDAFSDSREMYANTTQSVRLRRAYPIGSEHGYNRMSLNFRPEPAELDPAKLPSPLPEFLKSAGWTREQLQAMSESIWNQNALRGRLYKEVVTLGSIQPGDWVRVNWIRSSRGKHAALREANVKYNKVSAQKYIDKGDEKGWMLYALPFPTDEKDFDLLRIHVFADSKAAQKALPGMSSLFPSDEWARALEALRGSTETTRVEIYQVERSKTRK
jgi:hypothetical protein